MFILLLLLLFLAGSVGKRRKCKLVLEMMMYTVEEESVGTRGES